MGELPFRFGTPDSDEQETYEWIESTLLIELQGKKRAERLLIDTIQAANENGLEIPNGFNSISQFIPSSLDSDYPDLDIEKKLHDLIRWNAMMMVTSANKRVEGIGGHISTYASVSHLWEVGFNHHFRGKMVQILVIIFFGKHASPGIYARAWFDGRFSEENILNFRQEISGRGFFLSTSSVLMPNFWEYPTVSMG